MSVRAQASAGQESAAELSRRQLLNSSIALGAAASLAPLAGPQAALAKNTVLSSDWEKVSSSRAEQRCVFVRGRSCGGGG